MRRKVGVSPLLIDFWPTLPDETKAAILALVQDC